jgi:hypothetical protein
VQFAVKVTLAAMFCYIFYTAVDWNGIHTCMITCVIVALGSAGATIHKSALRLAGCAIGGSLALISIVFIIPKMTSIASLALLVAAVTAPAAWIAMGSERTAYLGAQLAFTYYLATLQGFGPQRRSYRVPRSVRRYRARGGRNDARVRIRLAGARRRRSPPFARCDAASDGGARPRIRRRAREARCRMAIARRSGSALEPPISSLMR